MTFRVAESYRLMSNYCLYLGSSALVKNLERHAHRLCSIEHDRRVSACREHEGIIRRFLLAAPAALIV
jgi:hypothetical protein